MGVTLSSPTSIEAALLYEMLDKTAYAVSMDETRYNINGVFVELLDSGMLRLVATDGHRLAMVDREADGLPGLDEGVIVPRKGIQELKKVLEGNDGAAKISINEGFFTVQSGRTTLGVRLIDGEFPDYRQVIPKENKTIVTASRADLLATVKRVSLVTTDKSRSIRFKLEKGTLLIASSSPEFGEAAETLEVQQEGEDVHIGFSAKYVLDLLNSMSASEMVSIRLVGELGPGVFIGDSDEQYHCVVMPMRFE
ncbi:MAG: DNA polymerase III subunit beta [Bdellovibrionales bacterium]|nr:DNA polymerase III subunit beta [Bdellovibrionales bacterium]